MDHITDTMEMVEHLHLPAFCVREGIIVKVNTAAASRMVESGTSVFELLKTGAEEYRDFRGGCLYLTVCLNSQNLGFSVCRKNGFDLFQLEQDNQAPELQAMALAARELREPLASIMITADQLFPSRSDATPEDDARIARINRGLFQMLRLISNMSDAGRYVTGTANKEIKNISSLFDEIFSKAAVLVEHAGIRLEYTGIPNAINSLANCELLERAVLNIISNAIKFTPKGGLIQATLLRRGNKLYLSIRDNGAGIPENLRGTLFSRCTREPGMEDGRYGIGLGFVMIRSAAAQHGGTVLVDHPEGGGTRVTMTLTVQPGTGELLRSPILKVDYAGERDHGLLELSEVLPAKLYHPDKNS